MPAKKIVSKAKKISKIKSKPVNKVKKSPPKSSLPKVKLKTGQPVLVRRSIMYVFVSSLILLFLINAFPAAIASIFYSDTYSSSVLGENDINPKSNNGKNFGKLDTVPEDEKGVKSTHTLSTTPNLKPTSTVLPKPSKSFDSEGNAVEQRQINLKNGVDIKAKTFDETGVESSYQFKDKNGSVVMLKVKEGDNSWSHLLYNEKNGMLLVKQKGAEAPSANTTPKPLLSSTLAVTPEEIIEVSKVEKPTPIPTVLEQPAEETLAIKINTGGGFDLIKNGIAANTNLPVEVDGEQGLVYVDNTELNINPDDAVNEAKKTQGLDTVENVTITKQNGVTTYMVKGVDSQKFLGLFDVTLPKTLYYSVDTNTLVSESKSSIQSLLDAFSF